MRILTVIVFVLFAAVGEAQTLPGGFINNNYRYNSLADIKRNDTSSRKWFVSKYSSISASYSMFSGGSASIISAPMGIQLNRKLNSNLYAFAGASIAPAYINLNSSYLNNSFKSNNNPYQSKGFGMFSRAELGLQYVSDDRTFSISGSFGVERNSYPAFNYNNGRSFNTQQRLPNY